MQNQSLITKKQFYKWHRILGLISLVPVIFWSVSGLSHPFMSNWFRPFIPQEVFKPMTQQQMAPVLSLQQVMDQNKISTIRNFSLVNFNKQTYYQALMPDSSYRYYSASNGVLLPNGDKKYAVFLARYFTQDSVSSIKSITLQTTFDDTYQPINRLLPVWKIAFNRADRMDVYVETSQSRLATFNNNTRKTFLWIFRQFHSWQFLADAFSETIRQVTLLIVIVIMILSLFSGITVYGLFWKRFKQIRQQQKIEDKKEKRFTHRYHRQLGLIVSFVMLTFTISGGFHLWVKLNGEPATKQPFEQLINRTDLQISNLNSRIADSLTKRISLIKYKGITFYQVTDAKKLVKYFNTQSGTEVQDGDRKFALYLSNYYRGGNMEDKTAYQFKTEQIKQFTPEYGFINKRLPVMKISYPQNQDWYIETSSAKLATKVAGIDRLEGFSFIFLHKYFGMTWAGKNVRDIVSMLAAAGVLVVSLFGFAAFIKNK
ncbi:PepSY domain-containing protein [Mucilaginibacter aquatilis]|uniref:PepSY domain-containing protein n=1 Tax=Mucilaginibacter aquatilis TaxID=1517760 RepID=A0A6I4I8A1_9SPHI|nr:PepSY domain-containing protein [Mucilaginibacter aquatilis]MVN91127.1 PepSY domain-containing protein [Mucilaginibacter aquatilis]